MVVSSHIGWFRETRCAALALVRSGCLICHG